jgi:hypothetical protein
MGYVELSGYFFIYNDYKPTVGFIVKATDFFILQVIKRILHIPNRVRFISEDQCYILCTTNNRAIQNIVNKFSKIQSRKFEEAKFKGVKSLMFKL